MKQKSALIIIDVQNDFCPNGYLAVPNGDEVIPIINKLARKFNHVFLTQDWHPKNHFSFASNHQGKNPFETINCDYGVQVLWPNHCVQGTKGAQFHRGLKTKYAHGIIRKGFNPKIDSYSAFCENDQKTETGLAGLLKNLGITDCYFVGLATDYCVAYSAIDARKNGFHSHVILDACRAINMAGSLEKAMNDMQQAGVNIMNSLHQ